MGGSAIQGTGQEPGCTVRRSLGGVSCTVRCQLRAWEGNALKSGYNLPGNGLQTWGSPELDRVGGGTTGCRAKKLLSFLHSGLPTLASE